jgi:hypothetical protein
MPHILVHTSQQQNVDMNCTKFPIRSIHHQAEFSLAQQHRQDEFKIGELGWSKKLKESLNPSVAPSFAHMQRDFLPVHAPCRYHRYRESHQKIYPSSIPV